MRKANSSTATGNCSSEEFSCTTSHRQVEEFLHLLPEAASNVANSWRRVSCFWGLPFTREGRNNMGSSRNKTIEKAGHKEAPLPNSCGSRSVTSSYQLWPQ